MARDKRLKRYLVFIAVLMLWAALYTAGRSPIVSDYLREIITGEVKVYTGQDVVIDTIFLNPVPLFLELGGVAVKDEKGDGWLEAKRIKIYVDIMDLIGKKLTMRRVLVTGAHLKLSERNIAMISAIGPKDSGTSMIEVITLDVRKSSLIYEEGDTRIAARDINLSAVLKDVPEIDFDISETDVESDTFSLSDVRAGGRLSVENGSITVETLRLSSPQSSLKLKGVYVTGTKNFDAEARASLNVEEVGRLLKLNVVKPGRIDLSGGVRYGEGTLSSSFRVWGDFYLESLIDFLKLDEPVRGFTAFQGDVNIEHGEVNGEFEAELKKGHLYGVDVDRLTCSVVYDGEKVSFKKGGAVLYGGTAKAEAYVTVPHASRYMVRVKGEKLNARDVLGLIHLDIDAPSGWVTGEFGTEGEGFNPEGWFKAEFKPEQGDIRKRIKAAKGSFKSDNSVLTLDEITIDTSDSTMTVDGAINLKNKGMALRGAIRTERLSDIVDPYLKGMSGTAVSSFSVSGTLREPFINAAVNASDIGYHDYGFDDLEAAFNYRKGSLTLDGLILSSEDEVHKISGDILFAKAERVFQFHDPIFDLRAEINNLKLRSLLKEIGRALPIEGMVKANVSLNGPLKNIRSDAELVISPVSIYGIEPDSIKTDMSFVDNTFIFDNLVITREDSLISGRFSIDMDGNYTFNTETVNIQLAQFPAGLRLQKGLLDVSISGKGTIEHPFLTSRLKIIGVMTEGVPVGYGEIDLMVKGGVLSVSGALFDGKADLIAEMSLADYSWNVALAFKRGVYDFIPAYLFGNIPKDLMLVLEGEVRLYGHGDKLDGLMNLSRFNLHMYDYDFTNSSDIKIALRQNTVIFDQVRIKSGRGSFNIEGSLVPYRTMDLNVYGDSSLYPLRRPFSSIADLKGYGSFVFKATGEWADPVVNGAISVKDATLALTGFPYRLIDLNSYIYIDNGKIVVESLSGEIGGGALEIKGYGFLDAFKVRNFYFDAVLNDATFRLFRGMSANFNANLIYKGEAGKSSIVGQVYVRRAKYTQRIYWKSQLLKLKKVEKPRGKVNFFDETELNIKIDGSDNILVDNNIAKTALRVDLILRGTVADPVLFGRVEADKGFVYFRNNEFEIIHASADFIDTERFNPYFDITAETFTKGYNIRIAIEGQLNQFNLSLLSDPHLDETDILGLLTFGERGSKLQGLEEGIGTAEATSFLTGKYQDVIEERLTMITGLDRVMIEPYVSTKTGAPGPRVTVSKRLVGDKLFVTYTSAIGVSELDIIKLEYELSKRISLIGVRDETGSLGSDIRFRFEFR